MSKQTAADTAEALEIRLGRRAPWTQVGDWVLLAPGLDGSAVRLYGLLAAHINQGRRKRGATEVWPTLHMLAQMMGYSRRDKIVKFVKQLEAIDAIEVEQVPVPGGGNRTRSIYTVHETPPDDYTEFVSLGDFYAEQKRKRADQKTKTVAAAADPTQADPEESPYPKRGTGPVPHLGYGTGTPNEVRNKKKQPTTNNESGGASRRPPTPPADKTTGHVDLVPTDQRNSVGNQPTARAERGVPGENDAANNESSAAVGIPASAVVGGDGARLELPSAREAAKAAAAEAKTRGTVRNSARKIGRIGHQKPRSPIPGPSPYCGGESGSESLSGPENDAERDGAGAASISVEPVVS